MKKLLLILCFLPMFSFGGTIYKVLSDTVFIGSIPYRTATGELLLFNSTKDTTESVLYNTGNGKTEFKKVRLIRLNDSTYVLKIGITVIGDTIKIRSNGSGGGGGGSGTVTDFIYTNGNGFTGTVGTSTTTPTLSLVADTVFKFASVKRVLDSLAAHITLINTKGIGSVTSVSPITLGTTGTDLTSSVVNNTSTPVITLNVPTASATNRGVVSSTDWSIFNGKESVLSFTSPLNRTINTVSIPVATSSVNGYLSSTDWSTFNGKPTATSTTTFTNKRITARVDSTTSSATPTINTDNVDTYKLTAQAADITSFTTNLSGTPTDDQILHIVIIGTAARAITWGSKFESSTVTLPTTTVTTNRLDVYFIWNTATQKWRCGGTW